MHNHHASSLHDQWGLTVPCKQKAPIGWHVPKGLRTGYEKIIPVTEMFTTSSKTLCAMSQTTFTHDQWEYSPCLPITDVYHSRIYHRRVAVTCY